jgi:hypothetical protein
LITSFWWTNFENTVLCFRLSPKQGIGFKKLCSFQQKALHQADNNSTCLSLCKRLLMAEISIPGSLENGDAFFQRTSRRSRCYRSFGYPQLRLNAINASGLV